MSTLTVLELLRQRASIREFTNTPVPDHILETVLLAALRHRPLFNFQQYTFVEIRDPRNRAELADICASRRCSTYPILEDKAMFSVILLCVCR